MEKNNQKKPLVSIVTPSYNHAQYIENAIESVKKQTYDNWELIIIDDGSTDGTHELLKSLPKDHRIKMILNKDNQRLPKRCNQAISVAKGDYISFLSSDDWYLPTKLEKQVELFSKLPSDYGVVYSAGLRYYEDLDKTVEVETNNMMKRGNILKDLLLEPFFIYPITPLIKIECFDDYPFDESYTAEGEAIYFKMAMKYKFDYVNEPLVVMREHSYNIGGNTDIMLKENVRYRNELFELDEFPAELKPLKGMIIGKIFRIKGFEYIMSKNELKKGRNALINSIKYDKKNILNYKVLGGILISFFKLGKTK